MKKVGEIYVKEILTLFIKERTREERLSMFGYDYCSWYEVVCNGVYTGITGDKVDCEKAIRRLIK